VSGSLNFAIVNFSKRIILIGGTAYTGEIKKGIFTILNYLLPALLPIHEKILLCLIISENQMTNMMKVKFKIYMTKLRPILIK